MSKILPLSEIRDGASSEFLGFGKADATAVFL